MRDDDRDLRLANLLAEFESNLSDGTSSTIEPDARPTVDTAEDAQRLENAKACLLRLERVWPHRELPDDARPETIARFRILDELGRGGFGIVYLAHDDELSRLVALKVQRPEALISPALRERFMREARAAARLKHPHVASVYEVGKEGWQVWIASEHIAGNSLAEWLRSQAMPPAPKAAATLVAQLADALEYAHQQGVLHRDLKPSNVLLHKVDGCTSADSDLSNYVPKLIDFGLAKLDEVVQHQTRTGALIGTPPYMAPEQAMGNVRRIGPATDVYGLGTVLYELLTGRAAFRGDSDLHTLRQVVEDDPVDPRRIRREIPADLEAIALKCLKKEPSDRYPTAQALAADLRRFLQDQPTLARPLNRPQRLVKWTRRRPALAGLASVSILAAAALLVLNTTYIAQLRDAKQAADVLRLRAEGDNVSAREQETIANRHLYASRMREGYELIERGEVDRVNRLLADYEPPSRLAELRGFEWHHLRQQVHSERFTLTGHHGEVYTVAYSPDGQTVVSAGQDGLIKLWDPTSGQEMATLSGHRSCVNGVAYSPDGKILASVSCDHTIKFWQTKTRELLATLDDNVDEVRCLAFSPDGTRLATGGRGKLVVLWDVADRRIVRTTEAPGTDVDFLAWQDDQTVMLPGTDGANTGEGQVVVWNVDTDEKRQIRLPHSGRSITTIPGGFGAAVGMTDGTICSIPDLSARKTELRVPGYSARSLAYLPTRNWLAAGYEDATVRVWGWLKPDFHQVLPGHRGRVQSVAFGPNGDQLASASFDGTVKLWGLDFESMPRIESSDFRLPHVSLSQLLAISPDFNYAAMSTQSHRIAVFDLKTGREVTALNSPANVSSLGFTADASQLYGYAPDERSVWKWNWREDRLETVCPTPQPRGGEFAIAADEGQLMMALLAEPAFVAYDMRSRDVWWKQPSERPLRGLVLSPSADACAITRALGNDAGIRSQAEVLDLRLKKTIFEIPLIVSAVSDRGTLIAIFASPSSVAVVDTTSGREICHFQNDELFSCAAFSADNRTIATGDFGGKVSLWNLTTGNVIAQFETDSTPVAEVRFSVDSRKLVAATESGLRTDELGNYGTCRLFIWRGSDGP